MDLNDSVAKQVQNKTIQNGFKKTPWTLKCSRISAENSALFITDKIKKRKSTMNTDILSLDRLRGIESS